MAMDRVGSTGKIMEWIGNKRAWVRQLTDQCSKCFELYVIRIVYCKAEEKNCEIECGFRNYCV
jgi:hypothetical protein